MNVSMYMPKKIRQLARLSGFEGAGLVRFTKLAFVTGFPNGKQKLAFVTGFPNGKQKIDHG